MTPPAVQPKRYSKGQIRRLEYKLLIEADSNKVAVCPKCNEWFDTYQERNSHRTTCKGK